MLSLSFVWSLKLHIQFNRYSTIIFSQVNFGQLPCTNSCLLAPKATPYIFCFVMLRLGLCNHTSTLQAGSLLGSAYSGYLRLKGWRKICSSCGRSSCSSSEYQPSDVSSLWCYSFYISFRIQCGVSLCLSSPFRWQHALFRGLSFSPKGSCPKLLSFNNSNLFSFFSWP